MYLCISFVRSFGIRVEGKGGGAGEGQKYNNNKSILWIGFPPSFK